MLWNIRITIVRHITIFVPHTSFQSTKCFRCILFYIRQRASLPFFLCLPLSISPHLHLKCTLYTLWRAPTFACICHISVFPNCLAIISTSSNELQHPYTEDFNQQNISDTMPETSMGACACARLLSPCFSHFLHFQLFPTARNLSIQPMRRTTTWDQTVIFL